MCVRRKREEEGNREMGESMLDISLLELLKRKTGNNDVQSTSVIYLHWPCVARRLLCNGWQTGNQFY